nr:MAG TPA: hypothetical protein [Caudoviricetes sp.]
MFDEKKNALSVFIVNLFIGPVFLILYNAITTMNKKK